MKLLTSLLDGIPSSGGALVLRGEPGIGKSRLLAEAARLARERGFVVLSTVGVQSETRLTFSGLHQLLRPVRARAADLLPAHRAALDAAFGLSDEGAPEQFRIAMAVLDLLSDVASDSPVLAIVEDAHWLDRPSADVLAFVARRVESDPIVVLVATRDGDGSTISTAGLPDHRIDALDPAAAAALPDASGPRLPAAVRDRLLREAGGNPLALIELPVAAREAEDTPMTGLLPLTERLEKAFAARVSDLPDLTRLLLLVAALNDEDHVAEVLQAGSTVARIALELASSAGCRCGDRRSRCADGAFPSPADPLGGPPGRERAAAPTRPRGARQRPGRRPRAPGLASRGTDQRRARGRGRRA